MNTKRRKHQEPNVLRGWLSCRMDSDNSYLEIHAGDLRKAARMAKLYGGDLACYFTVTPRVERKP